MPSKSKTVPPVPATRPRAPASEKKLPAKPELHLPALPGSWRERAKRSMVQAKTQNAKLPQMSGNFLSFRGGTISFGGQSLPSPMPVILLAYGYERSYYLKPYNPDVIATPDCYSFDGEVPHEKSPVPQSETCARCHFNEWGSGANGNGKGCKEGARLVLLSADQLKSPEAVAGASLAQARLSVLNSKAFRTYVENVFGDNASWSAISLLNCVPDSKSQYAVSWTPARLDVEDEIMDALAARVDEAEKLLIQPYQEIVEAAPAPTAAAPRKRKF